MSHPLDRELTPWLDKANALINRRVSDARVHAQAGRMAAAGDRLGELGADLERLIGRARVAFLRRSADRKGMIFGPDSEDVARTWPILGRTPQDLKRHVSAAVMTLGGASAVVGLAALKGWEARWADTFTQQVWSQLSDAQVSMASVVELMASEDEEGDHDDVSEETEAEAPEAEAGGMIDGGAML